MKEYSMRFLIAMIIGVCVMLLFLTGKTGQAFDNKQQGEKIDTRPLTTKVEYIK